MKKILSLFLTFALLLGLTAVFSSCSHECKFSTEWSKNDTAHWHACIAKEGCTEVSDNADHLWDEGEITQRPTTEREGVKTFTCTVCTATKTESIAKCELSTEWQKDETSHWRVCTNEDCPEIYEKADHLWDEGEITTKATQDADGVKTFTCTACSATKTESVTFTGMSRAEWNAAFADSVFENFAYKESATTTADGFSVDVELIIKFTKDKAWQKITVLGQSQESYAPDEETANQARTQLVNSLKEITDYSSYRYDAETKTYKATKEIYVASVDAATSDITLTFDNDRLVEIKFSVNATKDGFNYTGVETITISDYGTVVLPLPEKDTSGGNIGLNI